MPIKHPTIWPEIKYLRDVGAMPVKVSVKVRAMVTAGFANDVDEVKAYSARSTGRVEIFIASTGTNL